MRKIIAAVSLLGTVIALWDRSLAVWVAVGVSALGIGWALYYVAWVRFMNQVSRQSKNSGTRSDRT